MVFSRPVTRSWWLLTEHFGRGAVVGREVYDVFWGAVLDVSGRSATLVLVLVEVTLVVVVVGSGGDGGGGGTGEDD